jgi:SAM-dependent methyltransferase
MLDQVLGPQASYDLIASIYEHDMGRNMPFDDVGFYSQLARNAGRRTLELGCGTGRITRELLRAGLEVTSVDISDGMLREMRRALSMIGERPRIVQMDVSKWGLNGRFDSILCPYSLITYLTEPQALSSFLRNVRWSLKPGGLFIVDVFIPNGTIRCGERMLDYRRDLPAGCCLTRWKVIEREAEDLTHVVRRFYEVKGVSGEIRSFETSTRIRNYSPAELAECLTQASFDVRETYWDYGARGTQAGAQFVSYCCTTS